MARNLFLFTGKDFLKISVMMVLAVLFFGLTGLLMILLMKWMTLQSYGRDLATNKHGISDTKASRLGGAAIFICAAILLSIGVFNGSVPADSSLFNGNTSLWWVAVICCGFLGFIEDLKNSFLSPRYRLCIQLIIFSIILGILPNLVPKDLTNTFLDWLISLPVIGWLTTVVFCVSFINSVNMADGANGLVPGLLTIAFGIFFIETNAYVYGCLMTSCGLFALFNMISGRLLLGDGGAYALGAIVVLSGLHMFSKGIFSAWFLVSLLSYPCIDFVATIFRRTIKGRSVFLADDDHLHNRINYWLKKWIPSRTLANSLTGILIVVFTSGLTLVGYLNQWWSITSELWFWLF